MTGDFVICSANRPYADGHPALLLRGGIFRKRSRVFSAAFLRGERSYADGADFRSIVNECLLQQNT